MKTGFNVKTQIKTRLQQLAKQVGGRGGKATSGWQLLMVFRADYLLSVVIVLLCHRNQGAAMNRDFVTGILWLVVSVGAFAFAASERQKAAALSKWEAWSTSHCRVTGTKQINGFFGFPDELVTYRCDNNVRYQVLAGTAPKAWKEK